MGTLTSLMYHCRNNLVESGSSTAVTVTSVNRDIATSGTLSVTTVGNNDGINAFAIMYVSTDVRCTPSSHGKSVRPPLIVAASIVDDKLVAIDEPAFHADESGQW
jgi:hypothetical protein